MSFLKTIIHSKTIHHRDKIRKHDLFLKRKDNHQRPTSETICMMKLTSKEFSRSYCKYAQVPNRKCYNEGKYRNNILADKRNYFYKINENVRTEK